MEKKNVNFEDVVYFQEGPGVRNWQFRDSGIKLINIRNLVDSELCLENTTNYLEVEEVENKYKHFLLNAGDFVMASSGVTWGKIAEVHEEHLPLCLNTSIIRLVSKDTDVLDKWYLYYYIKSPQFRRQIERLITGSAQPNFGPSHLKKVVINLPEICNQREAVEQFTKVEAVINKRQKEIVLLDNLIKARFVEMFGDTLTNPLGWKEHRLDEYIDFLTSGSRGWAQYFVDEENELFITIKNVKNNHIILENIQYINAPNNKEAERTKVKTGDLLISITADLGRTGVVDEDIAERGAYINQHLSLVRLNQSKIRPLYVSHFLETEGGKMQFESKNQNGVKAGLNFDAIKSLKILVPPLEMQLSYLNFAHQVDKSKFVKPKRAFY